MEIESRDRVVALLFAGVLITSEIRMHLNQSSSWKNAQISAFHGSDDLVEVRHGKSEYIGCHLKKNNITLLELREYEASIINKLLSYCPRLIKSSCKFHLFSQLLIR